MKKFGLLIIKLIFSVNTLIAQSESVLLSPQYIDLSTSTSQSAILLNVYSYTDNTARYRLYNGTNYYYVWNEVNGEFVSSNSYSNNPLIPGDESTLNGSTWWIVFQRGNNNNLTATFGTRLYPYLNIYRSLPNAVNANLLTNPFALNGNIIAGGGYDLTVKYVVLGFDAVSGGNLLCAASTDLMTGNYILACDGSSTVRRVEFRTINNAIITSITNSTGWTSNTAIGSTPLPVELTSFSASIIGNAVKLNWKTETEINNYGFEVERYALSAERQAWEKIGFVNGNGNSNSPKSYSYEDKNVTAGKYSYRLKQIDNDGQFEYSKAIEVDLGAPKKFELSQNYPNPFNPVTTIRFNLPEAGNVKLTLFNILGQEIKTLVNEFKESGVHTINFDASDLNSGMYIYKIEAGRFVQTRKMTLVK